MLERGAPEEQGQDLLVMGDELRTVRVPTVGVMTLGSDDSCGLVVRHASIVPWHARLTLGEPLILEALDPHAPVHVDDRRVLPHAPIALEPGQSFRLGDVTVFIQPRLSVVPRRIWQHGYFEARIEEECVRAQRTRTVFALLRLSMAPAAPSAKVESIIAGGLRQVDLIGCYAPGQYEVLLLDTPRSGAAQVLQRLLYRLKLGQIDVRGALASYPESGRSADALVRAAHESLDRTSPTGQPTSDGAVVDVGSDPIARIIDRVAPTMLSVLILGETGVGKERTAERIHQRSSRAQKPLLKINCAALTESLLESELFGYEKGAFTGAEHAKPGLLETADGGTLFLDEVADLSPATQAKLLRVLENREVLRVGGRKPIKVDIRFIAATNRDLADEVRRGNFRRDLYYRLDGVAVVLKPLRDRPSELGPLAMSFISAAAQRMGRTQPPVLAAQTLDAMRRYTWPGNIRELLNAMERAVAICEGDELLPEHLPLERMASGFTGGPPLEPAAPIERPDSELGVFARPDGDGAGSDERERILKALSECMGNQTRAAKLLGISRRTLVSRLQQHRIDGPRKRRQ